MSAGERLPVEVERRYGAQILEALANTELLTFFVSNRHDQIRCGTVGPAIPGYEVKVVDENDLTVPQGEIGELVVSGSTAAIGYWNQREKSTSTFRGPWTYPGDKGFLDSEGNFHYSGRRDNMLKVSGNRVRLVRSSPC
jgi:acyl-coenzyme A synthetase/AMP-(fatty) acid ligase